MEALQTMRPITVLPILPTQSGIKIIASNSQFEISEHVEEITQVLQYCDGANTVQKIIELTNGLVNESFVKGVIADLTTIGLLIDSREYFKYFHTISSNPDTYPSLRSDEEIIVNHLKPRPQTKQGASLDVSSFTEGAIFNMLKQRKSCRSFSHQKLNLQQLGSILNAAYGKLGDRFSVPSAGDLYPMRISVIVYEDQNDFSSGFYDYDNENLKLIYYDKKPDFQSSYYALNREGPPFGAPIVFVISGDSDRQSYKYSNKAYKFMALEAGSIAQNITLAAIELGLSTCEIGALLDEAMLETLELNNSMSFLAIALGYASDEKPKSIFKQATKLEHEYVGEGLPVRSVREVSYPNRYSCKYFQYFAETKEKHPAGGTATCQALADVKAIAEGYERHTSGQIRIDKVARASEITEKWLDPREVAPLSYAQLHRIKSIQRFNEDIELEWVKGYDIDDNAVYAPIDLVFYPISKQDITRPLVAKATSSGFATYTDTEEAKKRAFLELIERDALMRCYLARKTPNRISFAYLPKYIQKRKTFWKQYEREVTILNISEHGIPIILVIITGNEYPFFVSGAASSLENYDEAAIKAFEEAETRLLYGLNNPQHTEITPEGVKSVLDHELLYAQSKKYHENLAFLFEGDILKEYSFCRTDINALMRELEAVTIDLSEENSTLKVVKVLSKKLIPISFGFGCEYYSHTSLSLIEGPKLPHFFA